jgi:hypothetical protein
MEAYINPLSEQIAVSHVHSFLAYQSDMSRLSLRGFLRLIPQNEFLEVPYS